MSDSSLDYLLAKIQASSKYQHVSPDLIRRIGQRELTVRGRSKEAIKATKNKLHQIGGAYFPGTIDYPRALSRLETATDLAELRQICRELMPLHTSTQERLLFIDQFYSTIFASFLNLRIDMIFLLLKAVSICQITGRPHRNLPLYP